MLFGRTRKAYLYTECGRRHSFKTHHKRRGQGILLGGATPSYALLCCAAGSQGGGVSWAHNPCYVSGLLGSPPSIIPFTLQARLVLSQVDKYGLVLHTPRPRGEKRSYSHTRRGSLSRGAETQRTLQDILHSLLLAGTPNFNLPMSNATPLLYSTVRTKRAPGCAPLPPSVLNTSEPRTQ